MRGDAKQSSRGNFMKTAAQILRSKPDQAVHSMEPTASTYEAARFMADKNIGAVVVMDSGRVIGIASERNAGLAGS